MTRDYKSRAQPGSTPKKRQCSCLFWFVAGSLAGAFVVGLAWLQLDPGLMRSGGALAEAGVLRPRKDDNPRPVSSRLQFEFPDLLKEMEVVIPQEELDTPTPRTKAKPQPEQREQPPPVETAAARPAPSTPPAAPAAPKEAYLLQLGSFRDAADAEQLRARLALMGIESRVQKVTIDGKNTYYRVRSGPYHARPELDEVRRRLRNNKIDSILMRWKS